MKPRMLLALSMVVFGTIGLFVRFIPLSSGEIALYRALLAAVTILIYLKASGKGLKLSQIGPALPKLLLTGMVMGLNWVLLFEAYRHTTVAIATICYYMAALIVTVLSPLIFRERSSPFQLLCFGLSLVGLVLMMNVTEGSTASNHLLGILLGLAAALLYATVIISNKLIKGTPGIHRTLIQFFGAILVLIPYSLLSEPLRIGQLSLPGIALMLTVGIFHTGITYCWYFTAIQQVPGREIALMSFLDPLVAVLLSAVVLRESLSPLQGLGGLMILLFTWLSERRHIKPLHQQPIAEE